MTSLQRLFTKKKWPSILQDIFSVWGLAGAVVTITGFFDKLKPLNDFLKGSWLPFAVLLAISIVWSIYKNWPKTMFEFRVEGRDASIKMIVEDAFGVPGVLVVPINNEFDAHLGGSVAKSQSIKAQVISVFFNNDPELLQTKLNGALKNKIYDTARVDGKYQMGTTTTIESGKDRLHFMVNSIKTNEKRVEARPEDLVPALSGLWTYLADHGPKSDVVVPLLGTGNGRLNIRREEVFKEIVRSFIASCSVKCYCERLTIAIKPDDADRHKIDIDALADFLAYQCRFATFQTPQTAPVGNPAQ